MAAGAARPPFLSLTPEGKMEQEIGEASRGQQQTILVKHEIHKDNSLAAGAAYGFLAGLILAMVIHSALRSGK